MPPTARFARCSSRLRAFWGVHQGYRRAMSDLDKTERNLQALQAAQNSGMDPGASAVHARWWQLETWLRQLLYVELVSNYGEAWSAEISAVAENRQTKDQAQGYMGTSDLSQRLAYLDATPLFELASKHWDLVGYALIDPLSTWDGLRPQLAKIRHRIGHCRRPHGDDLARLEQVLRDLEIGVARAAGSFTSHHDCDGLTSALPVAGWIRKEHADARRLVDHAQDQYEVTFRLSMSHRPWLGPSTLAEGSGHLWHARWHFFGGSGLPNLAGLWDDVKDLVDADLIYLSAYSPSWIEASFHSVDNGARVADLIGCMFDHLLTWRAPRLDESIYESWTERNSEIDQRIQILSPWSLYDPTMRPITYFGA